MRDGAGGALREQGEVGWEDGDRPRMGGGGEGAFGAKDGQGVLVKTMVSSPDPGFRDLPRPVPPASGRWSAPRRPSAHRAGGEAGVAQARLGGQWCGAGWCGAGWRSMG